MAIAAERVVNVRYSQLLTTERNIAQELEKGFGRNGLGILAVSEVPGYPELRRKLLLLAERVAGLPTEERRALEDPDSRYSFGWSHGKEILESGKPDVLKGSFYANPLTDKPTRDDKLIKRYPSYCRPNLWPHSTLPDLEPTFKKLGKLIFEVGLQLAYHCDMHASSKDIIPLQWSLQKSLRRSVCHKGRLLHYFPASSTEHSQGSDCISSWCGWHTDHGSLTGLTCAMYTSEGQEVPCPDRDAGLYVKNAAGAIVKAEFDKDAIAFQMGEATELLSGGLYHATPHCVRAAQGEAAIGVRRNAFALFLQPQWDEAMKLPASRLQDQDDRPSVELSFGDFSEQTISNYYRSPE